MVDAVSALAGHLVPRTIGVGTPGVTLLERRIGGLWQFSAWPGRLEALGRAGAALVGADAVPGPGRYVEGRSGLLVRTEPMRWIAVSETPLDRPDLPADDGTLLDLSHARTRIRVSGPATRDLLARHVSIDLRPGSFGDGHSATTAIGGLAVLLLARSGGVELLVFRSFALALWEDLLVSAEQFGAEVV